MHSWANVMTRNSCRAPAPMPLTEDPKAMHVGPIGGLRQGCMSPQGKRPRDPPAELSIATTESFKIVRQTVYGHDRSRPEIP